MSEAANPSTWLAGVDKAVRILERPYARFGFCRGTPAPWRLGLVAGLAVGSQTLIPFSRKSLGFGLAMALLYGLLAGVVLGTAMGWADVMAPRWLQRRPAGAPPAHALPGFAGLGLLVLFVVMAGTVPLMILLPRGQAIGAFWGALFLVYACLLLANQRAANKAMKWLDAARGQSLRAKLAPHFLFNTLNSLKVQIERDPQAASATVDRLASLFRQLVEAADRPAVSLKEELAFVEAYLGIEKARLGERLEVRVDVPEDLEDVAIPPFSLQVLVENAVKHGVAPLETGGLVAVTARREGPMVVLAVQDPGLGDGAGPGTGTALETLRQRLANPGDLAMGMVAGHHEVSFKVKA